MVRFAHPLKRNGRHNVGFQDKFFREKERGHALGVEILEPSGPHGIPKILQVPGPPVL